MTITRQQLFPLAFYKKARFSGSKGEWNYRIEKVSTEEGDEFRLSVWRGPFCYDATKEEKSEFSYSFDEEGMGQIVEKLNSL